MCFDLSLAALNFIKNKIWLSLENTYMPMGCITYIHIFFSFESRGIMNKCITVTAESHKIHSVLGLGELMSSHI